MLLQPIARALARANSSPSGLCRVKVCKVPTLQGLVCSPSRIACIYFPFRNINCDLRAGRRNAMNIPNFEFVVLLIWEVDNGGYLKFKMIKSPVGSSLQNTQNCCWWCAAGGAWTCDKRVTGYLLIIVQEHPSHFALCSLCSLSLSLPLSLSLSDHSHVYEGTTVCYSDGVQGICKGLTSTELRKSLCKSC